MAQSSEARALDMRSGGAQAAREPSMEEILASIKRIIEDTDNVRRPLPAEADGQTVAEALDTPLADNDAADVTAFRDGLRQDEPEQDRAPERAAPQVTPPAFAQPVFTPPAAAAPKVEPVRSAPQAVARAPEPEPIAPRPAIISDHAGRQVAAAFGELNDAFAASRRRSFDEIAEDMMRPMLQDWLDNNLPLLVERLVREEIERVARGGVR